MIIIAITKEGSLIPFAFTLNLFKNIKGIPIGICGVGRDITERKKYEEKIKQLISYDALTGLPNRSLFLEILRMDFYIKVKITSFNKYKYLHKTIYTKSYRSY